MQNWRASSSESHATTSAMGIPRAAAAQHSDKAPPQRERILSPRRIPMRARVSETSFIEFNTGLVHHCKLAGQASGNNQVGSGSLRCRLSMTPMFRDPRGRDASDEDSELLPPSSLSSCSGDRFFMTNDCGHMGGRATRAQWGGVKQQRSLLGPHQGNQTPRIQKLWTAQVNSFPCLVLLSVPIISLLSLPSFTFPPYPCFP